MIKDKCDKCGNPKKMYWCFACQKNTEDRVCDSCNLDTVLDDFYHDNCNVEAVSVHFYQGYGGAPKCSVTVGNREYVLEMSELTVRIEDMIEEKGFTVGKTKRQKYPRLLIND